MGVFNNESAAATLADLVGEGKKYATVDDLAKAYVNADTFISQLKTENEGIRNDLNQRLTQEEILEQIRQSNSKPPVTPTPEPTTPAVQPINEDELIGRLQQRLQEEQAKHKQTQNVEQVAEKLVETFGSETKANEAVKNKARELGVSVEFLQDVAAKSPTAFYQTLGLNVVQTPPPAAPRGAVNTQALAQDGNVKEGSYAYFENMRKTNPKLYWDKRTQNTMMKYASEKGDAFFN